MDLEIIDGFGSLSIVSLGKLMNSKKSTFLMLLRVYNFVSILFDFR